MKKYELIYKRIAISPESIKRLKTLQSMLRDVDTYELLIQFMCDVVEEYIKEVKENQ